MPYDLSTLAGRGDVIAYFGYGSLVNPHTHRTHIIHCERAKVFGFGRQWQQRSEPARYPVSFLTASHAKERDKALAGLLVFDYKENLPDIDVRESGYDRVSLTREQIQLLRNDVELPHADYFIYVARSPAALGPHHHILQSYLDAVLQGYLHQYGVAGAEEFMKITARFDTPIMRDRDTPLYARAVKLSPEEQGIIDRLTAGLNWVDRFLDDNQPAASLVSG